MDPETVDSAPPAASTSREETSSRRDADPAVAQEESSLDTHQLVARLVEAGEWPDPELLEQIVAAGDAAIGPLIAILRSQPRGWPAESVLDPVIGILTVLRSAAAIPELVAIARCYTNETAETAADALVDFGKPGFEALIELCNDPSIRGYTRNVVFEAAVYAATGDGALKSRLAGVLRPILDERIARAREELRQKGWLAKLPPQEEFFDDEDYDDFDDTLQDDDENEDEDQAGRIRLFDELDDDAAPDQELLEADEDVGARSAQHQFRARMDNPEADHDDAADEGDEPEIAEELAYVVGALADLADPLAREAIMSAFHEGLVDEVIIDQDEVSEKYQSLADQEDLVEGTDWLSVYREDYAAHVETLAPPRVAPRIYVPPPPHHFEAYEPREHRPVLAPIRNMNAKVGHNDPCWCGSGRKYKVCHLGQDSLLEPD
jgi:hypothetical protein